MEDVERRSPNVFTPLLSSDLSHISSLTTGKDYIGHHILTVHGEESWIWKCRQALQQFLSSKWGHYSVIILVSLDVAGIFADFLITLHICEHKRDRSFNRHAWKNADKALDVLSLVFSCLFMLELLLTMFAFGFSYFHSKFHIFDATVIVAGFVVDVLLHGVIEEVGSLVVIGRLWRVFKIIEEFSSAGEDQMEELQDRIEHLEKQVEASRKENEGLRMRIQSGTGNMHQE